ncbi:MAG: ATP-binding protein [candidate division SR1 bacterium]|nr:ATP-binding protein [candidate division SR1 bacterium]
MEVIQNVVYDTDYSGYVADGGYPLFKAPATEQKLGFFDKLLSGIFPSLFAKKGGTPTGAGMLAGKNKGALPENSEIKDKELRDQVKYLLELPDDQYNDQKLTSKMRAYIAETEKEYSTVINDYKSHIAPSYWEFKPTHYNVSGIFGKTYYAQSYPSYIDALRTRDIFSFHAKWDMSRFIFPEDDAAIQSMLKNRATQLKAEVRDAQQKGITLDMEVEQQYRDVEMIREKLTTREERYFENSFYINIYDDTEEKLKETGKKIEQKISGYGIRIKSAIQRMDEGFSSGLPLCTDELSISRSSVTSSLAGGFPFISNDMVSETGILYGINLHTGGLVIFDRYDGKLQNMNSVILATSGAGKSFTVKLEVLRYLINDIDVIIIDPENEYKSLCEKVGGTYVNIATNSQQYLNPFDIPPRIEDVEYGKGDLLRSQIMSLIGMIQILIGGCTPEEEALLDKALQSTYSLKGFSLEAENYEGKQPPIMGDLMNVLEGMEGGDRLALRLSKYVSGTFGKVFNNYTNIDINNKLTVISIRDLEDALKTPAMMNVLNWIWTKVRSHKKKRMLAVDEAWIMFQNETSAEFLFGLTKRARKYGLGITVISQDIEDFVKSKYGKPIISNCALQILLKQSTTSIKALNELLGLSEAEQRRLVSSSVGEGLIFAGNQHVGVKILASPEEKEFITTDVA